MVCMAHCDTDLIRFVGVGVSRPHHWEIVLSKQMPFVPPSNLAGCPVLPIPLSSHMKQSETSSGMAAHTPWSLQDCIILSLIYI